MQSRWMRKTLLFILLGIGTCCALAQSQVEAGFTMVPGQSAVLAEISEDWTTPVDTAMGRMGGIVFRRPRGAVRDDSLGWDYPLYPSDYQPVFRD